MFLRQLRGPLLNGEVLSLENCTLEVAYLSLLHWDDPSALLFLPDMRGKPLLPNPAYVIVLSLTNLDSQGCGSVAQL